MRRTVDVVRWVARLALIGALVGVLVTGVPFAAGVRAATVTVTTCADSGAGSLRQAVASAMPNDTINFALDCTGANAITLMTGYFDLTKNVTIDATAPSHAIVVNGNQNVVLVVRNGVTAALTGLTIQNGGDSSSGGGIANTGALTVTGVTITGSSTSVYGGGIYSTGMLAVINSTISGNHADSSGGGIYSNGTLAVTNSTVSGNTASDGGGIYNDGGTLTVTTSTITGNTGTNGNAASGGIDNNGGTLTVTTSTITGNTGGGIGNTGMATMTGSTVTGNTGGNYIAYYVNMMFPGTLNAARSIVPGLYAGYPGFTDGGNNFTDTNPLLSPLGGYGGPTQTLAPLPGSPVIDAGGSCTGTDQRGVTRPQGAACDIGAFESYGFTLIPTGGNGQSANVNTAFASPLSATVTANAMGEPVNGGLVTFTITPGAGGASAFFGAVGSTGCTLTIPQYVANPIVATCPITGGMSTAPPMIARGTAGSFTVVATTVGATTPATFTESVTGVAVPRSFVVTRAADDVNDANCTMASCTLRQAVNASNLYDPGAGQANTIAFAIDAPTGSPITLTMANDTGASGGGAFNGPLGGEFGYGGGAGAGLRLSSNVIIDATAPMHTIAVDGGGTGSSHPLVVFVVNPGITAAFKGLTIQNSAGGIVDYQGSTVTVTACAFANNLKEGVSGTFGGGIENGGTLTVTGSTFTGGGADGGGGIANGGTAIVTTSTFTNNSTYIGGAIENESLTGLPPATLTVSTSTFSGNTAGLGGAININGGTVTILTSTFSGNSCGQNCGGRSGAGGAIHNGDGFIANGIMGSLTVTNSTFANNTAPTSPSIALESNGALTLSGSIVVPAVTDAYTDGNHNLNSSTVDPKLGSLANNGGPTQTLALLPGSPAIDAGAATCPYTDPLTQMPVNADQRGVPRPQGAACDIGAYESAGATLVAGGGSQSATVNTAFAMPLTATPNGGSGITPVTFTITPGMSGASATFGAVGSTGCTLSAGNTVATCPVTNGVATSPPFTANGAAGGFTVVLTAPGVAPVTVNETNTPAMMQMFTLTAQTRGSNTGTATMPVIRAGASLTLIASPNTGGISYTTSNANVVVVPNASSNVVMGIGAGTATITATGPNGTATIVVTVTAASGGGLTNPNVQPMAHTAATAAAAPAPQPALHPSGSTGGTQPQIAGTPAPTPQPQPMRH